MKTMHTIYELLKKDDRTNATLLPIRIVADREEDIPEEAKNIPYEFHLRKRFHDSRVILKKAQEKVLELQKYRAPGFGKWKSNLIRLANQYGPVISYVRTEKCMVDIGINGDEAFFLLKELYGIKKIVSSYRETYVFDENTTDPDLYAVFKNVSFPLYPIDKKQEFKLYSDMGYEKIRDMVWHCYTPINGKPCGKCNTCVHYIRDGIYDRFDRAALLRYIEFCEIERKTINDQYHEIISSALNNQS